MPSPLHIESLPLTPVNRAISSCFFLSIIQFNFLCHYLKPVRCYDADISVPDLGVPEQLDIVHDCVHLSQVAEGLLLCQEGPCSLVVVVDRMEDQRVAAQPAESLQREQS